MPRRRSTQSCAYGNPMTASKAAPGANGIHERSDSILGSNISDNRIVIALFLRWLSTATRRVH